MNIFEDTIIHIPVSKYFKLQVILEVLHILSAIRKKVSFLKYNLIKILKNIKRLAKQLFLKTSKRPKNPNISEIICKLIIIYNYKSYSSSRACAACHFCQNNCFFILLSWLPTYFHDNFPSAQSWIFNVVPWLLMLPGIVFANFVSKRLIAKEYQKTRVRKIAETICLGTEIICLLIIGKYSVIFDQRGRPTVTAGIDHYFHTWCQYVCPVHTSQNLAKQNKFQNVNSDRYWRDCESGLVDHWWHTCLEIFYFLFYVLAKENKASNFNDFSNRV